MVWGYMGRDRMGHKETLGGNEYVHYLDCSDGFMDIYIFLKAFQIAHFKNVQFSCISIMSQ